MRDPLNSLMKNKTQFSRRRDGKSQRNTDTKQKLMRPFPESVYGLSCLYLGSLEDTLPHGIQEQSQKYKEVSGVHLKLPLTEFPMCLGEQLDK